MKKFIKIIFITLFSMFILLGYQSTTYINTKDDIDDSDEALIKEFRQNHGYSNNELKTLPIKLLREIDDYKIYYVDFNKTTESSNDWGKDGIVFSVKSHTRIIGIKSKKLYTIGNLIYETQINIKKLYKILPSEFK